MQDSSPTLLATPTPSTLSTSPTTLKPSPQSPFSSELSALRAKAPSLYHYNFAVILAALSKSNIIPKFDLRKCMQHAQTNGLNGLLQTPQCNDILNFFQSINLPAQMGYNAGTGLISLKFSLPSSRDLRRPISSYQQALVYCALGLHHQQHAFEYDFINLQRQFYILQQQHNSLQPFDIISYALDSKHIPPAHLGRGKFGCIETIFNILHTSDLIQKITIPQRPSHSVQTELLSQLLPSTLQSNSNLTTINHTHSSNGNNDNHSNSNSFTSSSSIIPRHTPSQLLSLANICLYRFFRQSQMLITDISMNLHLQTCTLVFRPARFGYIMSKPAQSGATHPLRNLLSFVEVTPQMNDIEYHIISQYQMYLQRKQQANSLTMHLKNTNTTTNTTTTTTTTTPTTSDNNNNNTTTTTATTSTNHTNDPILSTNESTTTNVETRPIVYAEELYHRYFFDFIIPIYKSDDSTLPFTYSPIYSLITGYNPLTLKRDQNYLEQQQKMIISILQSYFWHYITTIERYYPTPILRDQMNGVLERYFQTGLNTVRCGFNPQLQNLSLFLFGTAGTGKSTFVRVLCATLYNIIDYIFEPGKRVEITRMPFNQTTPAALASLLMVRGISDWSLERIVEQTVSRGGLSLLHLEEQPPDPSIQDELYSLITRMTKTLLSRYPEYRHNVINILTANYPPSHELAKTTNVIEITPPNRITQQIWICKTAEDMIASNLIELDTGNVRFSLSYLEQCPLVQFISHPSDKPPFVTSTWNQNNNGLVSSSSPTASSSSSSSSLSNTTPGGYYSSFSASATSNSSSNTTTPSSTSTIHSNVNLSNTFHTTIQRPLYSISARMNEPGFEQQYMSQYHFHNNLNSYSQSQSSSSSSTTTSSSFNKDLSTFDSILNFFGFSSFIPSSSSSLSLPSTTTTTTSSPTSDIPLHLVNDNYLDGEFKYSNLIPFFQQYEHDLALPSPFSFASSINTSDQIVLPQNRVIIGHGPHDQQFISRSVLDSPSPSTPSILHPSISSSPPHPEFSSQLSSLSLSSSQPQSNIFDDKLNRAYLQFNLHIDLLSPPPFTFDLRKLEGWKRSVSYAILQHLTTHITTCATLCGLISSNSPFSIDSDDDNINSNNNIDHNHGTNEFDRLKFILPQTLISLAISAQISQQFDQLKNRFVMHIDFDAYDHIGFRQRATLSSTQYKEYQVRQQNFLYKQQLATIGANKWGSSTSTTSSSSSTLSTPTTTPLTTTTTTPTGLQNFLTGDLYGLLPPLRLISLDGYFFHPEFSTPNSQFLPLHLQQQYQTNIIKQSILLPTSQNHHYLALNSYEILRINAIIAMWKSLFLQPAVIVIAGPPNQCANIVSYIHHLISNQCIISDLTHFPSQEHITSKDNALFPTINTNITYSDSLKVPIDANHFDHSLPIPSVTSLSNPNDENIQNNPSTTLLSTPHDDCLISPPFSYDTFLEIVRSGNDFISPQQSTLHQPSISNNNSTQPIPRRKSIFYQQHQHRHQLLSSDRLDAIALKRTTPELFPFYAIAHTEQHKLQLFGEPDPSRSILTRFITQVQNHHVPKQSIEFNSNTTSILTSTSKLPVANKMSRSALYPITSVEPDQIQVPHALGAIFVSTNGPGQFYFRDLIDTGESSTHITKTQKDGLLFVLVIDNTKPLISTSSSSVSSEPPLTPITTSINQVELSVENDIPEGDTSSIYAVQPQVISRSHIVINLPNNITPTAKL